MIDQFKNNLTPKYWKDIKQDTFIGVEFDLTATCKVGMVHQKLLVKHFPILDEDTFSIWIKRYWEINKKSRKLVGATRFILCILADTISEGALNILSSIPFKDSTGMKNTAGYALVVDLESKKIYGKPPRIPPNLRRRCESVIACIRDTYKIYKISLSPRPGVTRKKMRSELKQWGFGLIAFGILHIILKSFLDPFWGVILIIVGIFNIFVSHRAMFLLNGSAIMTAAVFNMMVIVEAEANAAFMLVIMQFAWGINEIRKFKLYDMRREMAESHPESEPDGQRAAEPGLEAGASPSGGIQRRRFKRFIPVVGACLLVAILGFPER